MHRYSRRAHRDRARGPRVGAVLLASTALLGAAVAGCSSGGGGSAGPLAVGEAWVAQSEDVAAVYLTVDNQGGDDRLVGATAAGAGSVTVMGEPGGGATSHEGAEDEEIDVEVPQGTTGFRPGERHIMLDDLVEPLEPGDRFEVVLEFERNGTRAVDVEVLSWEEAVERIEGAAP